MMMLFLRPILEIVIEWIGVNITPATWKHDKAEATMTEDISSG